MASIFATGCGDVKNSEGDSTKKFAQSAVLDGTYKLIDNKCDGIDSSFPTSDQKSLTIKGATLAEKIKMTSCTADVSRKITKMTDDRIETTISTKRIQGCTDEEFKSGIYSYRLSDSLLKITAPGSSCASYLKD